MNDATDTGGLLRGRYALLRSLGEGGQGQVMLARDERMGGLVAVKQRSLGLLGGERDRELFERECRVLAAIQHPAAPRFVDAFVEGNDVYLAMEYVDGVALSRVLADEGPLPEVELRRLLGEVGSLLEQLHGTDPPLIHRDIKPSNLMRRRDGAYLLVDFGLVSVEQSRTGAELTRGGTLGFMAEEQAQGKPVARTDIYALGMTVLVLATGREPLMNGWRPVLPGDTALSPAFLAALARMVEPSLARRAHSVVQAFGGDPRVVGSSAPRRLGLVVGVGAAAAASLSLLGLGGVLLRGRAQLAGAEATAALSAAPAPAPAPPRELPGPYASVHIGTTQAELEAMFPSQEPLDACAFRMAGGDRPLPSSLPGALARPHARCVRAEDVAGLTDEERSRLEQFASAEKGPAAVGEATDLALYVAAQVKAASRAGALPDDELLEAARGRAPNAHAAALVVASDLVDGARKFTAPTQQRRPICAVVEKHCQELDPERARDYVLGSYSLGQLDADARSRGASGKCRGIYVQNEARFKRRFGQLTGAFAGLGLARSSQADRKVSIDAPASYAIYSLRSGLSASVAKVGVRMAVELEAVERYWTGAVALRAVDPTWGPAIVWLREGVVERVLVNVTSESKLGELPSLLEALYGTPGKAAGARVEWSLPSGERPRLDLGASTALFLR